MKNAQEKGAEVDWFTAQLKGQAQLNDKTYPISAQLRMRQDSVIWISVSAILGLEAARIHLTPDSVKLINRLNSTYFIGNVKELTKRYNLHLSFNEIQNVLLAKHSYSNPNTFKLLPSEQDYIHKGIARRSFNLGWKISPKCDIKKISATMDKGLLSIFIPFTKEATPKSVTIK